METMKQTEPSIGSEGWWAVIDAHVDAYWGYPEVQESIRNEAYETHETVVLIEELYRREDACQPIGELSMTGAML